MPTTYAHYKFGEDVLEGIKPDIKKKLEDGESRELYNIGLHGPDLFFYYRAFSFNKVNRFGSAMHKMTGKKVFGRFAKSLENTREEDREKALAYACGFMCHYALDKNCHPYIGEKVKEGLASHSEIEAEFDGWLMRKDGFDPVKKKVTGHLKANSEKGRIISVLFPEFTPKTIEKSIKYMITILNILVAPGKFKRGFLKGAFTLIGQREHFGKLIINKVPAPACAETNEKLGSLYEIAKKEARGMIEEFYTAYEKGCLEEMTFDRRYEHTFGEV